MYSTFKIKSQNFKLEDKDFVNSASNGPIAGTDVLSSQHMKAYCGTSAFGYGFFDSPAKKSVENCKKPDSSPQFAFSSPDPANVIVNSQQIFNDGYTALALYET